MQGRSSLQLIISPSWPPCSSEVRCMRGLIYAEGSIVTQQSAMAVRAALPVWAATWALMAPIGAVGSVGRAGRVRSVSSMGGKGLWLHPIMGTYLQATRHGQPSNRSSRALRAGNPGLLLGVHDAVLKKIVYRVGYACPGGGL